MKSYKNRILFIFIILIFIIYISYHLFFSRLANQKHEEIEMPKEKNKMTSIRISVTNFDILNPINSQSSDVQRIAKLVFEPLIAVTEDFKLEACLATEWSKLDSTTYIIKLNRDAKWHDGKQFDAKDVAFTIQEIQAKENNSLYYENVENIQKVEIVDDNIVKIVTKEEEPYFEYNLTFPIMVYSNENKTNEILGTGKYYVEEETKQKIVLKANQNWWKQQPLTLDTIDVKIYPTINRAIEDFRNQEVDFAMSSNNSIDDSLEGLHYHKIHYIDKKYTYISINMQNKILKNKEIRQIIERVLDREKLIEELSLKQYKVSYFPLDFGSYLYDSKGGRKQEKEGAESLLQKNGWKFTKGKWRKKSLVVTLKLLVNKEESEQIKAAKIIQKQLAECKIPLELEIVTKKKYEERVRKKEYELLLITKKISNKPSLESYVGNNNLSNFQNKEMKTLLKKMEEEESETKKEILYRVQEIYNDEVPMISLYYDTSRVIYTSNLTGKVTPNSYDVFYHIEEWYREYEKN